MFFIVNKNLFSWRGDRRQDAKEKRAKVCTWRAISLAYMGPAAHTPPPNEKFLYLQRAVKLAQKWFDDGVNNGTEADQLENLRRKKDENNHQGVAKHSSMQAVKVKTQPCIFLPSLPTVDALVFQYLKP
jgi:hypothetical protein